MPGTVLGSGDLVVRKRKSITLWHPLYSRRREEKRKKESRTEQSRIGQMVRSVIKKKLKQMRERGLLFYYTSKDLF